MSEESVLPSFPWRLATALLFGGLSTLAHGPIHAWWFALGCLAGWLLSIRPRRHLQNLGVGFAFGVGWFTAGGWWLAVGLWRFTAAGAVGAFAITTLLVIYLSCFPAIAGLLIGMLGSRMPWPARSCMIAAGWTSTAWLGATLFGGLPWMSVGTGQIAGPLSSWAPIGGGHLVEFVALLAAAGLAEMIFACTRAPFNRRQVLLSALWVVVMVGGSVWLKNTLWTQPTGVMTVRLAQGNLPQDEKFSLEGLRRAAEVYGTAIANSEAELTILPETAFPMTWEALPIELRDHIRRFATEQQTTVLLGALVQEPSGSMTNDLLLIRPGVPPAAGETSGPSFDDRYVKEHLVFMGEYLPASLSWLGKRLNVAYSSLSSGVGAYHVLDVGPARIAATICFEGLFGAVNAARARDANLLVNISNFGWFAGTWAADEDLDAIRMRSLETGRWTARVANSGITALIDDQGDVVDALAQDVAAVLDGKVELRDGLTPYARAGDLPVILLCSAMLLLGAAIESARSRAGRGK
jgi:apolipoprotein N-acyltransferase